MTHPQKHFNNEIIRQPEAGDGFPAVNRWERGQGQRALLVLGLDTTISHSSDGTEWLQYQYYTKHEGNLVISSEFQVGFDV